MPNNNPDDASTDVGAAFQAGFAAAAVHEVDGESFAAVPKGWEYQHIDTDEFSMRPRWPEGIMTLFDEGSFTAYVKRFWRQTESIVLADASGALHALFDHHIEEDAVAMIMAEDPGKTRQQAGRGVFGAAFYPLHTPSWAEWTGRNEKTLTQDAFLEFLEKRIPDILTPDGAELREVVQFFRVHGTIGFSSGRNLTNGTVQFQWTEEQTASGGGGDLIVPTDFEIMLQPYKDLPDYRKAFKAQLRWRITQNAVTFSFHLRKEELDEYVEQLDELRRLRVSLALGADAALFFGAMG